MGKLATKGASVLSPKLLKRNLYPYKNALQWSLWRLMSQVMLASKNNQGFIFKTVIQIHEKTHIFLQYWLIKTLKTTKLGWFCFFIIYDRLNRKNIIKICVHSSHFFFRYLFYGGTYLFWNIITPKLWGFHVYYFLIPFLLFLPVFIFSFQFYGFYFYAYLW